MTFGLDENLLRSDDNIIYFGSAKEKIEYYEKIVVLSPAIDFEPSVDYSAVKNIMSEASDLWQSEDIESDIADIRQRLEEAGIDELISNINEALQNK